MSHDEQINDDLGRFRGDNGKSTRDSNGRWLAGHCPNPKGRPKKKPKVFLSESDLRTFGNMQIDIVANGREVTMDRRTALLNKIFESAMKGKISSQRFLHKEFEKNDERLAAIRVRYDQLIMDRINGSIDYRKPDYDEPFEIELEIEGLRTLLNHYYPGSYSLHGRSEDDASDDDDG